jgi:hypothetical protein
VKEEITPVLQAAEERWIRMERRRDDWILVIVDEMGVDLRSGLGLIGRMCEERIIL